MLPIFRNRETVSLKHWDISKIWSVLACVMWRPYVVTKKFREQGIKGSEYKLWTGSIEEIKRMKKDAPGGCAGHQLTRFHYKYFALLCQMDIGIWWNLLVLVWTETDIDMVKQVLSDKFGYYPKNDPSPHLQALVGKSLAITNGQDWARHRRAVNPAFTMDKLKMMTKTIQSMMMEEWEAQMLQDENNQAEIDLSLQFKELAADVFSHAAIGSSYKERKRSLSSARSASDSCCGLICLNSKCQDSNNSSSIRMARRRNDLLGLMLEACALGNAVERKENCRMNMDEIIGECKMFFHSGHETTSHLSEMDCVSAVHKPRMAGEAQEGGDERVWR